MSYASDCLRQFHEAFEVTATGSYRQLCERRITLHGEEHDEVEDALDDLGRCLVIARREKLEALAGELADEMVLLYGTADLLGIDLDRAFAIKMAANMAKLPTCEFCGGTGIDEDDEARDRDDGQCWRCNGTGKGPPIKREDGKILRPAGWTKPSMAAAIK